MTDLVTLLASLVGFGAFVSVLVNILKFFKVAQDGDAQKWVLGFNALGLIALVVWQIFFPTIDLVPIDNTFGVIAQLMTYVLMLLSTFGGSFMGYKFFKGVPLLGFSHTLHTVNGVR